ncbi:Light-harvesting complex [Amphidinium carterae]
MQSNRALAVLFLFAFTAPCCASGGDVELSDEEMIDAIEAGDAIDSVPLQEYGSAIDSSMDDELVDTTTDEPESTVKTETSTTELNEGTQGTPASTSSSTSERTQTSRTTASSGSSTTSSESTSSSSKSSSSTTATTQELNATSTSSTTTTTALVEGSLSFEVTNGSASDLVDGFANDTDGTVAQALATAIAAGADGVEAENVTILSVAADNTTSGRRLASAHLRSSRALQANAAVVVEYRIVVPAGADSAAVADALTSSNGAAAIEAALTTELQAVDPSLTVGSIEVVAEVVQVSTATTTVTERDSSFARRAVNSLGSLGLAFSIATLLLQ